MGPLWIAPAAVAAVAWLWFLARGKARAPAKRLALRITLLMVIGALAYIGARRGALARTSFGFRAALTVAMAVVAVGYLYSIRFCDSCGRMVRNLKVAACPRCGAALTWHGMTNRLRRPEASEERRRHRAG